MRHDAQVNQVVGPGIVVVGDEVMALRLARLRSQASDVTVITCKGDRETGLL